MVSGGIQMTVRTKAQKRKFSRLRSSLLQAVDEIRSLIEPFLKNSPIMAGSVYEIKRKCGKSNCKCTRGELHGKMVLSTKEEGRTKLHSIPKGQVVETRIKTERRRKLRRAKTRLRALHREILDIIDEMEAMRKDEIN